MFKKKEDIAGKGLNKFKYKTMNEISAFYSNMKNKYCYQYTQLDIRYNV